MKKYKYNINNLDCANCAREIEESLNKNKDFKNVVVNFNTSKLSYESLKEFSLEEVNNLVKKIEPEAYLSEEEVETKNEFSLRILIIGLTIGLLGYFLKLPNMRGECDGLPLRHCHHRGRRPCHGRRPCAGCHRHRPAADQCAEPCL